MTTDIGSTTSSQLVSVAVPGYRLRRRVGSDAIGIWFDAEQESLGRKLTVRVLKLRYEGNEQAQQAFLAEIDRLTALVHPNLVRVLDARRSEPLALITERVGGRTLADVLAAGKPLGEEPSLAYASEIVAGLGYLLKGGLVCRNLSAHLIQAVKGTPTRIITVRNIVSLKELARLKGRLVQDSRYVAPEQLGGEYPVGARTPCYQVAAVLFHMLSGRQPHVAPSPVEQARAHLREEFPRLKRLQPFLSPGIYGLISASTQRDPAARPSLGELARRLASLRRASPRPGVAGRRKRRRRR